jgi:hypothetical protein
MAYPPQASRRPSPPAPAPPARGGTADGDYGALGSNNWAQTRKRQSEPAAGPSTRLGGASPRNAGGGGQASTGHQSVTKLWNKLVPSNKGVTVILDSPRCARAPEGEKGAAE